MSFFACLPLIEPDIPAVLALDQRCLGGLWTRSGYLKELESDHSDLLVLLSATDSSALSARAETLSLAPLVPDPLGSSTPVPSRPVPITLNSASINAANMCRAATDPNEAADNKTIKLLGIGCLWAILEEAHITTLAIEPAQQRQKLGQLLLSELLLQGYRRGLTRATLEVRVSNQKAFGLYQAFGFQEAGQRRRYYSDGENARVLWRSGLREDGFVRQIIQKRKVAIAQLTQANHQYLSQTSTNKQMLRNEEISWQSI
ncbi:MAG: GNAT family N-acetyltransferase [Cyanobacteria bacterium P01_D01_bin.105]